MDRIECVAKAVSGAYRQSEGGRSSGLGGQQCAAHAHAPSTVQAAENDHHTYQRNGQSKEYVSEVFGSLKATAWRPRFQETSA